MNRGESQKVKRPSRSLFDWNSKKIAEGFYTDKYFIRTRQVLLRDHHRPRVLMQVFAKKNALVCGIDEALAAIRAGAQGPRSLRIRALCDGETIHPWETVMTIEGEYSRFAHLETIYLGILARRTMVATAVKRAVEAAKPKPVLFFSARFDHFLMEDGDGYAAKIGGVSGVSTDAGASWWKGEGIGTIPHALIAAYGGDTVKACVAFDKFVPRRVKRIALVDFDNDSVRTSLAVARALGRRLWAVRLDTSEKLRDRSVRPRGPDSLGVCPELVRNVRRRLDQEGFPWVKIIVSGGFTVEKVLRFQRLRVPFDAVGIGSALFHERIDFTADIVRVDGKPCAKVGRQYKPNPRLRRVS